MHFKTLALILGLAGSAHAAPVYRLPSALGNAVPVILPGRAIIPMTLPAVNATAFPINAPASLPVFPLPSIGPVRLPGVPSPLPLPTPAVLASARRPAPSSLEEPFALNWSLLDDKAGDEPAAALVPNDPGPKPLSPAGAVNALLREIQPGRLFDGSRPASQRELELPHNRYF